MRKPILILLSLVLLSSCSSITLEEAIKKYHVEGGNVSYTSSDVGIFNHRKYCYVGFDITDKNGIIYSRMVEVDDNTYWKAKNASAGEFMNFK